MGRNSIPQMQQSGSEQQSPQSKQNITNTNLTIVMI